MARTLLPLPFPGMAHLNPGLANSSQDKPPSPGLHGWRMALPLALPVTCSLAAGLSDAKCAHLALPPTRTLGKPLLFRASAQTPHSNPLWPVPAHGASHIISRAVTFLCSHSAPTLLKLSQPGILPDSYFLLSFLHPPHPITLEAP